MRHLALRSVATFALTLLMFLPPMYGEAAAQQACNVQELMLDQSSAPGAIAPAFAPDGLLVVYGKTVRSQTFLFESEKVDGLWSNPHKVSFSGTFTDIEPAFAPNGKYLVFSSNRPMAGGAVLAEGNYDGKVRPGHGGHLWRGARTPAGWGPPQPLPSIVNASDSTFSPTIAGDGTLYFMRPINAGEKFHLYTSRFVDGQYNSPERVSFSNLDAYGDFDPVVAKDGSFLVFSSPRPPSLPHRSDLFIVYRTPDGWSEPIDLRSLLCEDVFGVEARLSSDNKTLYFTNSRRLPSDEPESPDHPYVQHTWQVDVSSIRNRKVLVRQ